MKVISTLGLGCCCNVLVRPALDLQATLGGLQSEEKTPIVMHKPPITLLAVTTIPSNGKARM